MFCLWMNAPELVWNKTIHMIQQPTWNAESSPTRTCCYYTTVVDAASRFVYYIYIIPSKPALFKEVFSIDRTEIAIIFKNKNK